MHTKKENTVIIRINLKDYATIIDEDNIQRFPVNTLIRHLVDTNQIDLNRLCIDYNKGKFTLEEYQSFYRDMGYSVCGFEEIFGCNSNFKEKDQVQIENPLWEETNHKKFIPCNKCEDADACEHCGCSIENPESDWECNF